MRKLLYTAICALMLTSCVNGTMNQKAKLNDTCHVERYFHEFMAQFPDGLDNDIKKDRMNAKFVADITDSLKSSNWLLEDFPIRFEGVKTIGSKYYVHFQSWLQPDNFDFKDYDFHEFAFDIIGEVPLEVAENLVEDNYYIIHGKLNRFITHEEFSIYSDGMAYSPNVGIEKEIIGDNINWHLGEMFFDIDSISPYTK